MAVRQLRFDGDEILHKKSRKVEIIDDRIKGILQDMADTMYAAEGVGLAAVQVGILRQLVVIDIGEGLINLINPEIVEREGEEESEEACLSVPGYFGMVTRPKKVKVEALNIDGEKITIEAEGFFKKALCHEIDHLSGLLYTDVASRVVKQSSEYELID